MAAEGSAVFRAIADFRSLRREGKAAASELRKVKQEAKDTGTKLEQVGEGADRADAGLGRWQRGLRSVVGVLHRVGNATRDTDRAVTALAKAQQVAAAVADRLAAARRREADALGVVRVAETALAEVRTRTNVSAAQLASAEERLARATRSHATARANTTRLEREHAAAVDRVSVATDRASDSSTRWGKALTKVTSIATSMVSTVARAAAVTAALGGAAALASAAGTAAAGGIIALVGAIGQLAGLAVGLPAILAAAAVGMGVLKLATAGFGDAVKGAFGAKTLAEFDKATEGLAPSAKAVTRVVFDLRKELSSLKETAQQALFSGLDVPFRKLITSYLPDVKSLVGDVASSFNRAGHTVADFLLQSDRMADVRSVLDGIRGGFRQAEGAVKPLTGAVLDLLVVGGRLLPEIGAGITDMATRFGAFIAKGRETGALERFFRNAVTAAKLLGTTIKNVGSIIGTIFEAGRRSGTGFLETLARITGEVDRFLKSPIGQSALADLLESAGEILRSLGPVVRALFLALSQDLFPLLADIAGRLGPGLTNLVRGLGEGLRAAAPGLREFFTGVAGFLTDLGEAAPELGSLISKIGSGLGPVLDQLGSFIQFAIELLDALPAGALYAIAGGIIAAALAIKGLAVASTVIGHLDRLGVSLDRTRKHAESTATAISGDGKGKGKGGGGAVAGKAGLVGALAALALAAVAMDQINTSAAGGEENLRGFEENLHDIVGAGQQIMALDFTGIFADLTAELAQIRDQFASGQSPVGAMWARWQADTEAGLAQVGGSVGAMWTRWSTDTTAGLAQVGGALAGLWARWQADTIAGVGAVSNGVLWLRDRFAEAMAMLSATGEAARGRVDAAMATVRGVLERLSGFLIGGLAGAVRAMGGVWSEVMGGIERVVSGAVDRITGALHRIRSLAASAREQASSIGGRLLDALPGFARGGRVPGRATGPGDNMLAAVRSDEWIINAKASRRFGPLLEAINRFGGDGASLLDPHDLYSRFATAAAGGGTTGAGLAASTAVSAPAAAGVANPNTVSMGDVHLTWHEHYPQAEKPSVAIARRMQRMTRLGLRQALAQTGAGGAG